MRRSTHIDDDVKRVVVGEKDTDTAAVLHSFVIVEAGQLVHLRVAGRSTGLLQAPGLGHPPPPVQVAVPVPAAVVPAAALVQLLPRPSEETRGLAGQDMGGTRTQCGATHYRGQIEEGTSH